MVGLLILKHMFALSDEGVWERWVYNPDFQHFTGEERIAPRFLDAFDPNFEDRRRRWGSRT